MREEAEWQRVRFRPPRQGFPRDPRLPSPSSLHAPPSEQKGSWSPMLVGSGSNAGSEVDEVKGDRR